VRHDGVRAYVDAQRLQIAVRRLTQPLRKRRQNRRTTLEEDDPCGPRIEMPEVARQRLSRDLGQRAGHLDACRSATDDDKGEKFAAALRIHFPFGALECQQDAAPDLQRVLQGFETGRDSAPFVVAEIGVRSAGGKD
jgi:hypothetical protein